MNTKTDNVLRIYYHKLNKHLKCLISTVSPTLNSKIMFLRIFGRRLNLKNPKDFNEKLMWLKLNTYKNNNLVTLCADKYKVREYISERGYSEILNEMIDSWDSVDDIKWEGLPNKFALKCNHGAGYNIICTDKEKLDINATIEVLKKWMKEDFWKKKR